MKAIHIYDMDGTIVDSSHRYRTAECGTKIDLAHWRQHDIPEYIAQDKLLPLAGQYQKDLANPEIYVIIATARACEAGDANYEYIARHLGLPDKFVHRLGVEDRRGGAALKIQAIKPLLNLRQFRAAIVRVWEDNASYLRDMCLALGAEGFFVQSVQGH